MVVFQPLAILFGRIGGACAMAKFPKMTLDDWARAAAPFLRLHGHLVYLNHPVLTADYTEPRIREIFSEHERTVFNEHNDLDFCHEADHGRYRANAFRQRKQPPPRASMRRLLESPLNVWSGSHQSPTPRVRVR